MQRGEFIRAQSLLTLHEMLLESRCVGFEGFFKAHADHASGKAGSAKQRRIRLPVFEGRGGLVAGVDPLSNKALLEALGDDA